MQLDSWILNHNKHFFLIEVCSENGGRVGWGVKGKPEIGKQFCYRKRKTEQTSDEYEDKAESQLYADVYVWMLVCNPTSSLQVENNSRIVPLGGQPLSHRQDFPTADEELVEWARQKFGGVTSFTKVQNLMTAVMTGVDGE